MYIRMYTYTYIYTCIHIYVYVCVDEAGSLMLVFVSGFGCTTFVWGGYD